MSKDQSDSGLVYSMTGYANVQKVTRAGTLTLELRSVNSRFLDLNFRMPDDLRTHETTLREKLNASLSRGKVEIRLSWGRSEGEKRIPTIDLKQVQLLAELEDSIKSVLPQAGGFRVVDVLNWPGVVEDDGLSADEMQEAVASLCDTAIDALKQTRAREGEQLGRVLLEKIDGMARIIDLLTPQLPQFVAHYEGKVRERMTEFFDKVIQEKAAHLTVQDLEERVKHEVALHSVRIDVSEEIDRLQTHFKEVRRILKKGGVIGKRLDFVTQELNREANTLGSKAHAIAQTQASIDLKVLVEQFREQIQNIE
ncbi:MULTISPECIES: YicC/YloC family endoribonuclease [Limnobacter]|uniref:YicC family protein n=1 Tax=Limnobacter litoralis TaxID=481366 RepID=A0ABQ5YW02_9BURK|nr:MULTISPECIES: YicC/YloC family endoribonuclease [Limnobacter]GLR26959.1 hypothetical protein GCM10007875_20490 [Limnobacter litoralis]HEX5485711.1 YicC/YloC family endoribonuclease [Limnobacter sp.]